jgi:hypothetical protein
MAGTAATEPDATTTGAGGGGGTMRAVVRSRYGGPEVLEPATVERPTPAADEVLIAVRAASVNAGLVLALASIPPDSEGFQPRIYSRQLRVRERI